MTLKETENRTLIKEKTIELMLNWIEAHSQRIGQIETKMKDMDKKLDTLVKGRNDMDNKLDSIINNTEKFKGFFAGSAFILTAVWSIFNALKEHFQWK